MLLTPVIDRRRATAPPRVAIPALAYHKVAAIPDHARHRCNYVTPGQFKAQLRYLSTLGYRSISFAELLAYRRGDGDLPRRPILITFDDGYRSILEFALPTLADFGFVATVFVVTDRLGETNRWDADEIQEPLLSRSDLSRVVGAGHEIQSHTQTHRNLTQLTVAEAWAELQASRLQLEAELQRPVDVIAYPWGATNDCVQDLAQQAGYRAGVILRRRVNFDSTPALELRRIGVNHETSLPRFAWDLARLRFRGE